MSPWSQTIMSPSETVRRSAPVGGAPAYAAPFWAGFTALVNEEAAANGQPPVGFLNPALYALGRSADYTNCFHDITVGNNATPYQWRLVPRRSRLRSLHRLGHAQWQQPHLRARPPGTLGDRAQLGSAVHRSCWRAAFNPSRPELLTDQWHRLPRPNRFARLERGPGCRWLTVSPTNGTNLAGGPATVVTVTPNVLASNLAAGSYTATLILYQPQRSVGSEPPGCPGNRHASRSSPPNLRINPSWRG